MGSTICAIGGDRLTRAICEIEQQALSQVIGAPMNLVECRLDGCARCVFQLG